MMVVLEMLVFFNDPVCHSTLARRSQSIFKTVGSFLHMDLVYISLNLLVQTSPEKKREPTHEVPASVGLGKIRCKQPYPRKRRSCFNKLNP